MPLTVMNGTLYHFIFATAIASQMLLAERQAVGLLQSAALPNPLQVVLGVLILGFVIYIWHLDTGDVVEFDE